MNEKTTVSTAAPTAAATATSTTTTSSTTSSPSTTASPLMNGHGKQQIDANIANSNTKSSSSSSSTNVATTPTTATTSTTITSTAPISIVQMVNSNNADQQQQQPHQHLHHQNHSNPLHHQFNNHHSHHLDLLSSSLNNGNNHFSQYQMQQFSQQQQPLDKQSNQMSNHRQQQPSTTRKKQSTRDPYSHRMIEKRRRDRMNNCLTDLSRLIPDHFIKKQSSSLQNRGRIEKTEIIEMAIKYMKYLLDICQPFLINNHNNENDNEDNTNKINIDSDITMNTITDDSLNDDLFECLLKQSNRLASELIKDRFKYYKYGYLKCFKSIKYLLFDCNSTGEQSITANKSILKQIQQQFDELTIAIVSKHMIERRSSSSSSLLSNDQFNGYDLNNDLKTSSSTSPHSQPSHSTSTTAKFSIINSLSSLENDLNKLMSSSNNNLIENSSSASTSTSLSSSSPVPSVIYPSPLQAVPAIPFKFPLNDLNNEIMYNGNTNKAVDNDINHKNNSTMTESYHFKKEFKERFQKVMDSTNSNNNDNVKLIENQFNIDKLFEELLSASAMMTTNFVPVFALHPSGDYYVPMNIESAILGFDNSLLSSNSRIMTIKHQTSASLSTSSNDINSQSALSKLIGQKRQIDGNSINSNAKRLKSLNNESIDVNNETSVKHQRFGNDNLKANDRQRKLLYPINITVNLQPIDRSVTMLSILKLIQELLQQHVGRKSSLSFSIEDDCIDLSCKSKNVSNENSDNNIPKPQEQQSKIPHTIHWNYKTNQQQSLIVNNDNINNNHLSNDNQIMLKSSSHYQQRMPISVNDLNRNPIISNSIVDHDRLMITMNNTFHNTSSTSETTAKAAAAAKSNTAYNHNLSSSMHSSIDPLLLKMSNNINYNYNQSYLNGSLSTASASITTPSMIDPYYHIGHHLSVHNQSKSPPLNLTTSTAATLQSSMQQQQQQLPWSLSSSSSSFVDPTFCSRQLAVAAASGSASASSSTSTATTTPTKPILFHDDTNQRLLSPKIIDEIISKFNCKEWPMIGQMQLQPHAHMNNHRTNYPKASSSSASTSPITPINLTKEQNNRQTSGSTTPATAATNDNSMKKKDSK